MPLRYNGLLPFSVARLSGEVDKEKSALAILTPKTGYLSRKES